MIKRYGTSAAPREDGVFCLYAEYEKLVAERDRLDRIFLGERGLREIWERRATEWCSTAQAMEVDRDHWKANHDNQVSRARFLIERGDIPLERVRAYGLFGALLALEAAIRDQRAMYEGTSDEDNMSGMGITQALALVDAEREKEAA